MSELKHDAFKSAFSLMALHGTYQNSRAELTHTEPTPQPSTSPAFAPQKPSRLRRWAQSALRRAS
jgi:hypothetical protein